MKNCEICSGNKQIFKHKKTGKILCRNCKRTYEVYGKFYKPNEPRPYQLDLVGKKFGRLLVLKKIESKNQRTRFLCKCNCGKIIDAIGSKIKNGSTKSCGCLLTELKKLGLGTKLPPGIASRNRLISSYKHNAKNKGQEFKLSNDKLIHFFKQNCYYCGTKPENTIHTKGRHGKYVYNGIDRLDNDLGYTSSNCVSCCKECNYRKNTLHHDDFILWVKKVYTNLKLKEDLKWE